MALLATTLTRASLAQTLTGLEPGLSSISPAEGSPGTSVNVTLNGFGLGGGIVNVGPGITPSNPTIVQVNDAGGTQVGVTFSLAPDAPLGPSPVGVSTSFGTRNALVFTIVAPPAVAFVAQQRIGVAPGGTVTASTAPTVAGQSGLRATLLHSATASAATLQAATYTANPTTVGLSCALGFVDLRVGGASTADTLAGRFYTPPNPCAPAGPLVTGSISALPPSPCFPASPIRLEYYTGTAWAAAYSSGQQPVLVDATPNLDGTISAFRITATFDATSSPTITALGGTVFAAVLADTVAPASTATPKPGPLPAGLPLATVTASATVRTTSGTTVGTISPITCFDTRGLVVILNATDNAGGSGVQQLTYTLSSPGATPKTASVPASGLPTSVSVSAAGLHARLRRQ